MSNFTPKRASEQDVFTVDFAALLAPGETIQQANWSITPVDGIDPAAAAMIFGPAGIEDSEVSQMIVGGVAQVTYSPICTAQTSTGRTLVLPDPNNGLLYVTA